MPSQVRLMFFQNTLVTHEIILILSVYFSEAVGHGLSPPPQRPATGVSDFNNIPLKSLKKRYRSEYFYQDTFTSVDAGAVKREKDIEPSSGDYRINKSAGSEGNRKHKPHHINKYSPGQTSRKHETGKRLSVSFTTEYVNNTCIRCLF